MGAFSCPISSFDTTEWWALVSEWNALAGVAENTFLIRV
jgi:hypothetical protein